MASQVITVSGVSLTSGSTLTVTYGSGGGANSVTVPETAGAQSFSTSEKSTSSGTLTALSSSPSVTVSVSADGSGTMTVSPSVVTESGPDDAHLHLHGRHRRPLRRGRDDHRPDRLERAFDNLRPCRLHDGLDGYGQRREPGDHRLRRHPCRRVHHDARLRLGRRLERGRRPHRRALRTPSVCRRSRRARGRLPRSRSSPQVNVIPPDGVGTMSVSPTSAIEAVPTTLTFTYTAPSSGLSSGAVTLTVPSGWTAPSTSSGTRRLLDGFYRDALCRRPGGHRLWCHAQLCPDLDCHLWRRRGNGPRCRLRRPSATPLSRPRSARAASGTLTALSSSPIVSVVAPPDGTGTMTVSPTSVLASVSDDAQLHLHRRHRRPRRRLGRRQRPFGLDGAFDELDPCRLHDRLSRDAFCRRSGDHGLGAHPQLWLDAHRSPTARAAAPPGRCPRPVPVP